MIWKLRKITKITNDRIRIWGIQISLQCLCDKERNDKTPALCRGWFQCGVDDEVLKTFYSETTFRWHLKMHWCFPPIPGISRVLCSKTNIHGHRGHLKDNLLNWAPAFVTQLCVVGRHSFLGVSVFLASWNLTRWGFLSFDLRTHFSQAPF